MHCKYLISSVSSQSTELIGEDVDAQQSVSPRCSLSGARETLIGMEEFGGDYAKSNESESEICSEFDLSNAFSAVFET